MRNLELIIVSGLLIAWLGVSFCVIRELSTVRPNVERIILDLNKGVSK
jgi:hypothetical protein